MAKVALLIGVSEYEPGYNEPKKLDRVLSSEPLKK
jgi:hypothetical protein